MWSICSFEFFSSQEISAAGEAARLGWFPELVTKLLLGSSAVDAVVGRSAFFWPLLFERHVFEHSRNEETRTVRGRDVVRVSGFAEANERLVLPQTEVVVSVPAEKSRRVFWRWVDTELFAKGEYPRDFFAVVGNVFFCGSGECCFLRNVKPVFERKEVHSL